jgi:hypothetical protein
MTDRRSWEQRAADFEVSFINQPYVVDFEVPETPTQRAHRKWGMTEQTLLREQADG